jgi:hypothetical protein
MTVVPSLPACDPHVLVTWVKQIGRLNEAAPLSPLLSPPAASGGRRGKEGGERGVLCAIVLADESASPT